MRIWSNRWKSNRFWDHLDMQQRNGFTPPGQPSPKLRMMANFLYYAFSVLLYHLFCDFLRGSHRNSFYLKPPHYSFEHLARLRIEGGSVRKIIPRIVDGLKHLLFWLLGVVWRSIIHCLKILLFFLVSKIKAPQTGNFNWF